jgi:hypothetical protein
MAIGVASREKVSSEVQGSARMKVWSASVVAWEQTVRIVNPGSNPAVKANPQEPAQEPSFETL